MNNKIAKPAGVVIKCPYCGGKEEIAVDCLDEKEMQCPYIKCQKFYDVCSNSDFAKYLNGGF